MGVRHVQVTMAFLAFTVAYIYRTDLSVAIVAMTAKQEGHRVKTFNWSEQTKSNVLASLFVGYIIGQFPGGMIAEKYGAKIMIGSSMLTITVTKFLTPVCTITWGWVALVILRIIEGAAQGTLIPAITVFLSRWIPPNERYSLRAPTFGGIPLGSMIGLLVSGPIAHSFLEWPFVYYVDGTMGLIWCSLWWFYSSDTPDHNKYITEKERAYIKQHFGDSTKHKTKGMPIPWKEIAKSKPFYALLISHVGRNWGYFTILVQAPRYMEGVVGVSLKQNAYLSALPYLVGTIMIFVYSWAAVYVQNNTNLSATAQRKLWNTIALWGPALALYNIVLWDYRHYLFIEALLCISIGTNTAVYSGFMGNHIDLSPNFSGTLMSCTNFFGAIASMMAPLSVTLLVYDRSSISQWNSVFLIAGTIMFLSNIAFLVFGSAEVQPWNEPKSTRTNIDIDTEQGVSESNRKNGTA